MRTLRLISFDADQTLFDFQRTLNEALDAVSAFLKSEGGLDVAVSELREVRDRIADEYESKAIDMLAVRQQSFREIVSRHKDADRLADGMMEVFTEIRFGRVYWNPGVLETLRALRGRYVTALLTNGNTDPARAGLDDLFDHVLLAEKYPYKKPDPRLFGRLYAKAGVTDPGSVMHVGDSLESDVRGANGAGAISVWFNPAGEKHSKDAVPDYTIAKMPELLVLLEDFAASEVKT